MSAAFAPDDAQIVEALGGALCGRQISSLQRRPYPYATSFPLEELHLQLADGQSASLILKDLTWERLPAEARLGKPATLHDARREIETYRRILLPSQLGPRCLAARHDPSGSGSWLVLEKVQGVELWQVGDLSVWSEAARWVARLHARFSATEAVTVNPYLLRCDAEWFRSWAARAREGLVASEDRRSGALIDVLDRYDPIAHRLGLLPRTLVHGEYFPSNILVDPDADPPHVWPVDWEMSAVGPCLLDPASLVTGWDRAERERLIAAYREEMVQLGITMGTMDEVMDGVRMCQLHFALQWLGWSRRWTPPAEHARDWVEDALISARELSLL